MHETHKLFYNRYIKLIKNTLRSDNKNIHTLDIEPTDIIPMCCELPMWIILSRNNDDKIFMLYPNDRYKIYDKNMVIINDAINNKTKINISVFIDPETNVKCFLFFNRF